MKESRVGIDALMGKVLSEVRVSDDKYEIIFVTTAGETYKMFHDQSCCEDVAVEDICGDLGDLIGSPIVHATEDTNEDETPDGINPPEHPDSYTWTFYNIATAKGHVTLRWLGESTGCYSESVDFCRIK